MRKAYALGRPAICSDIALACAAQELRGGRSVSLSRTPALGKASNHSSLLAGRYQSKESIVRAFNLIECISNAARRIRDEVASRFLAHGGPSDYLPVLNSADGTMLRRTADSIIAHYDGPLAGLCTDARTGDIVMRDNARVPLDVFRGDISLLAWALLPPLKATGEQNTGPTCDLLFYFHNMCGAFSSYFYVHFI